VLEVHAAEGGVVDDAVGAGDVRCEAGEAVEGAAGFAAGGGDPGDVEDDASVAVVGAGDGEDELGTPGGGAVAFEVQRGVGFDTGGTDLAGLSVDAGVAGCALNKGVMTLPSAWTMRLRSGWVHDPGPFGSRRPTSRAWSAASSRWRPASWSRMAGSVR
jgi:hypothetical protein